MGTQVWDALRTIHLRDSGLEEGTKKKALGGTREKQRGEPVALLVDQQKKKADDKASSQQAAGKAEWLNEMGDINQKRVLQLWGRRKGGGA